MRDVIWTIITIWLVYKLIDVFKTATAKKTYINSQQSTRSQATPPHNTAPKKDMKNAMRQHLNKDGEYVDFEEIK